MKYAIWRHENSLGNSAEQTVGLARYITEIKDKNPQIFVEKDFQKAFAMCIPGVEPENIEFFEPGTVNNMNMLLAVCKEKDIKTPSVYDTANSYPGGWEDLFSEEKTKDNVTLQFPHKHYKNKFNLPSGAIIIQIREIGTHDKRVEGASFESNRFVNPSTFFTLALEWANAGYTVVRIGDPNQTPMPQHSNIIDFSKYEGRTMLDDLYLIDQCKVFVTTDTAIWPIAGGMKKNLLFTNVTSIFNSPPKYAVVGWLPKKTTVLLYKKVAPNTPAVIGTSCFPSIDNTIEEIRGAMKFFLK